MCETGFVGCPFRPDDPLFSDADGILVQSAGFSS